jgi:hypothetical protein
MVNALLGLSTKHKPKLHSKVYLVLAADLKPNSDKYGSETC